VPVHHAGRSRLDERDRSPAETLGWIVVTGNLSEGLNGPSLSRQGAGLCTVSLSNTVFSTPKDLGCKRSVSGYPSGYELMKHIFCTLFLAALASNVEAATRIAFPRPATTPTPEPRSRHHFSHHNGEQTSRRQAGSATTSTTPLQSTNSTDPIKR